MNIQNRSHRRARVVRPHLTVGDHIQWFLCWDVLSLRHVTPRWHRFCRRLGGGGPAELDDCEPAAPDRCGGAVGEVGLAFGGGCADG